MPDKPTEQTTEQANETSSYMDFVSAIKAVRGGAKVRRKEWRSGETYIYLDPAHLEDCHGILIHHPGRDEPYSPTVEDVVAEDWQKLDLEQKAENDKDEENTEMP